MGKTTALTAYAAQPNIYYYYVDATVTPRVFLKGLLQDMGVKFEGSLNEMVQKVTTELNTTEAPLLILDESAKLNDKMLLILHSIRDKTFKNCGIVLAGMPDFKTQLFKKANKRKTGYSEFLRRVNVWEELQGLTTSERNGVLKHYGITDEGEQKKFRKTQRFGDLKNEIDLYLFEQSTTN